LTNDLENINTEFIQNVIDDYDTITESQEFPYPSRIRKKVKKEYENKFTLPSSLAINIVELCDNNKCCIKV
jgi:hypothetical protein